MDKIEALAEYFGIDADDIVDEGDDYFDTPEGEFRVFTEEEADEVAVEEIKNIFDDLGLDSFSSDFQTWVLNNALDEDEVNNFIDTEIDYFENEEEDEDLLSYLHSLDTLEDKIGYIKDLYGDSEEFNNWASDKINIDMVAEEVLNQDGRGPTLAAYDGEEVELPGDYFRYRMN